MGEGKVWVGPSREDPAGQFVVRETSLPSRDHAGTFSRCGSRGPGPALLEEAVVLPEERLRW